MNEEKESFDYNVEDDEEEYSDELDEDSSSDIRSSPDLETKDARRGFGISGLCEGASIMGEYSGGESSEDEESFAAGRSEVERMFEKSDRFGSTRAKEECKKVLLKIGDQGRHLLLEPSDFDTYWNSFKGHVEKMFDAKGRSPAPASTSRTFAFSKYAVVFYEREAITGYPKLSWNPTAVSFERLAYFSISELSIGGDPKAKDAKSPLTEDARWLFGLKASGYPHVVVKRVQFRVITADEEIYDGTGEGFRILEDRSSEDVEKTKEEDGRGGDKTIVEVKKGYYPSDEGDEVEEGRVDFRNSEKIGLYRVVYKYSGTPIAPTYWNVLPRAQLLTWKKEDEKKKEILERETRDASRRLKVALENLKSVAKYSTLAPGDHVAKKEKSPIPDEDLENIDVERSSNPNFTKKRRRSQRDVGETFDRNLEDDPKECELATADESGLASANESGLPIADESFGVWGEEFKPAEGTRHDEIDLEILEALETFVTETLGPDALRWIREEDDDVVDGGLPDIRLDKWAGFVPDWNIDRWGELFDLKVKDVAIRLSVTEEAKEIITSNCHIGSEVLQRLRLDNELYGVKFQRAANFRNALRVASGVDTDSLSSETWTSMFHEAFDYFVYLFKMIRRHENVDDVDMK
jgi:hypothetical protein